jgi:hypothetical protein
VGADSADAIEPLMMVVEEIHEDRGHAGYMHVVAIVSVVARGPRRSRPHVGPHILDRTKHSALPVTVCVA